MRLNHELMWRATYSHSEETSRGEASIGPFKILCNIELCLIVRLSLEGAIGKSATIVEALESSIGGSGQRRRNRYYSSHNVVVSRT